MNTIQHHDNWPDTFKDPLFWDGWRNEVLRLASTAEVTNVGAWSKEEMRTAAEALKRGEPRRHAARDCGRSYEALNTRIRFEGGISAFIAKFARQSASGASLTGTEPETAPEGASVPSGALVLRKLG